MKENDRVRLIIEIEKYACKGVHKGMDGIICDPRNINGQWLVCFDQYGELPNIATIPVKEDDLELVRESPERKADATVLLLAHEERYITHGITKGMFGVICEQCADKNYWNVKFVLSDGVEKIIPVYYNDIAPIRDDEVDAYKKEVEKALKRRQNG